MLTRPLPRSFEKKLKRPAALPLVRSRISVLPKVGYVMSRFPKLTETFVLYEILALQKSGVEVQIYPLIRERQTVSHPEIEKVLPRVRFLPFLSLSIIRAQLHFLRRKPAEYLRALWDVLRGTWGSANFFLGALGIFPKVARIAYEAQKGGIAHVHCHFASHPALAGVIIHRLTGIPFSFTAHGSDLHVERRFLDTKVRESAFVVTVSDYNKELIVRECGEETREKIHVIHCGVDPEVFQARPHRMKQGPPRLLCVASFEEVKGHAYLIKACELLHSRGTKFVCDFVGDGPLRRPVERQIREANLEGVIRLHGPRSRPEIARFMAKADVMVLPSVPTRNGKREGVPVVLMEAMASRLPVVSSDLSGIPELVDKGRTGLLTAPRDVSALADALQTLIQDAELRSQMGLLGREKVLKAFDLYRNAGMLLKLFRSSAEDYVSHLTVPK
jgi:glycosyltransferase involved in cell wall biosynthesis